MVATQPATGPGVYQVIDSPLLPGQLYTYRLLAELTHGALRELGTVAVTPYSATPPANVLVVDSHTHCTGALQTFMEAPTD